MITNVSVSATVAIPQLATSYAPSVTASNGDFVLVVISADDSGGGRTVTAPTGWTVVREYKNYAAAGDATAACGIYSKIIDGSGIGQFTLGPSTSGQVANVVVFKHNITNPKLAIGNFAGRSDAGSGATTTTTVAPSLLLSKDSTVIGIAVERTIATETDAQITVSPGQKNSFTNVTNQTTLVVGSRESVAGQSGIWTVTYPNSHARNGLAGQIALYSDSVSTPVLGNKDSVPGSCYVGHNNILYPIVAARKTNPGISIANVMSGVMYCAHRGGSDDYPEMSAQAYKNSALDGFGTLEISLSRSSDGVLFGLHDRYLDRVVLGTNTQTLDPNAMTWSQISQLKILGSTAVHNTTQPNGDFVKFVDLISMYDKHVFMFDAKYMTDIASVKSVLDITDAHGGKDRFIYKSFGTDGSSAMVEVNVRNYKSWGYFYSTNMPAIEANPSLASRFTYVGLPWDSTQQDFDKMRLISGRDVFAHICSTKSQVETARLKGATGFQCSGSINIGGLASQQP